MEIRLAALTDTPFSNKCSPKTSLPLMSGFDLLQEVEYVLNDWLVVFLIMQGLLVSISTCSVFWGTTTMSTNIMLSKLFFLSCLFLSCSKTVLLVIENEFVATLYTSFLQATYVGHWWDTLVAKRSINGFPIFTQGLWNTEAASFHSEESVLRRDSMPACLFSRCSQICLERQTICKLFVHSIFRE